MPDSKEKIIKETQTQLAEGKGWAGGSFLVTVVMVWWEFTIGAALSAAAVGLYLGIVIATNRLLETGCQFSAAQYSAREKVIEREKVISGVQTLLIAAKIYAGMTFLITAAMIWWNLTVGAAVCGGATGLCVGTSVAYEHLLKAAREDTDSNGIQ